MLKQSKALCSYHKSTFELRRVRYKQTLAHYLL